MQKQKNEKKVEVNELLNNRISRKELARQSFEYFMAIYFNHFLQYESPAFHQEITKLITCDESSFSCIVSFRGSAKSTLCTLMLPLWQAICVEKKKFIVIVCQSQTRANQTLYNIRQELENNELLVGDFGPFLTAETSEWNSSSLVLKNQKARISAVSVSESIRGIRHGANRPDLVIADDIEDVQSARILEQRDKLWEFVNGELIPVGSPDTSYIFIGNLVHQDSVMMRLKKSIQSGSRSGVYKEYPLLDLDGKCLWPSKYPNQKAIDKLRNSLTEVDFAREYLLQAINTSEQTIKPAWIHYYDQLPDDRYLSYKIMSIDPAFSTANTADKSAIICASLYKFNDQKLMYIHPEPFNGRLNNPNLINYIEATSKSFGRGSTIKIIVEQSGQQIALVDQLASLKLPVIGKSIKGQDKSTRLWFASNQLKNAQVLFPKKGAEELIQQLLLFGSERFDDLADAFTLACAEHRDYLGEYEPIIDWL